ncbi:hypothetical protein GEMRC1_005676 [Eukaryota sp. GEM-RC1]
MGNVGSRPSSRSVATNAGTQRLSSCSSSDCEPPLKLSSQSSEFNTSPTYSHPRSISSNDVLNPSHPPSSVPPSRLSSSTSDPTRTMTLSRIPNDSLPVEEEQQRIYRSFGVQTDPVTVLAKLPKPPTSSPILLTQPSSGPPTPSQRYLKLLMGNGTKLISKNSVRLVKLIGTNHFMPPLNNQSSIPNVSQEQHNTYPALNGFFLEYFVRRVICEKQSIPFSDTTSHKFTHNLLDKQARELVMNMGITSLDILPEISRTASSVLQYFKRKSTVKTDQFENIISKTHMVQIEQFILEEIDNVSVTVGPGLGIIRGEVDLLINDRLVEVVSGRKDPPLVQF